MKTLKNFLNAYKLPLASLLFGMLLFSACKKTDPVERPYIPAAGVMAFNLAPDKASIGFALSGNTLGNAGLNYTGFTGVYLPVYTGTREVRSFDNFTGSTLAISSNNFKDSTFYSAFLLGANGNYRNVVLEDDVELLTPVAGNAWVRYVNAIPDSSSVPAVTVGANNENAPYATVSAFRQIAAGPLTIAVNNGSNINASRTINVEEHKIYTVLLVGLPNHTDPSTAVQIRFVVNGIATQE